MEDEMVGWHDRHNGREFEQTLGDSEGQGSLACCSPRGHKEADTTERLNEGSWRLSVKNPPANAEDSGDGVQSLGREDPLEKEMATHSCIPVWEIPWMEGVASYSPRGCKELDTA